MDDYIYEEINVGGKGRNVSLGLFMKKKLYGSSRIEVYESEAYGRCLYLDDSLQCSEFDEHIYHETLVHTCFGDNDRRNVLIIGGGDGGTLREVLKYKDKGLEKIVFVEINREVIDVCKQHFPSTELEKSLADPIVELVIEDGAKYLERYKGRKFDAIFIDCPDPSDESEVLYSRDFIEHCLAPALNESGFVGIQAGNAFIKEKDVRALQYELKRVFRSCKYTYAPMPSFPSGGIGFLFAGNVAYFSRVDNFKFKTDYIDISNINSGRDMIPKSFKKNQRLETLVWYFKNISDITKNWRNSKGAQAVFKAFMELEDEPHIDPQHTFMSFLLCFMPELSFQEVNFWTNEPERIKEAVHILTQERFVFPNKKFPINGVSFGEDRFTLHQLINVEDARVINERIYNQKPEICFDEAVLSTSFNHSGEKIHETVTYSDLSRDYVVNGFDKKPAEFLNIRIKTNSWRERLEPSILETFDKIEKAGMILDRGLWVHRGRANLRFRAA